MSGCSIGSPPVNSKLKVPSSLSLSMRALSTSVGTGSDSSSNSLQYVQDRLQRRTTTSWARKGPYRPRLRTPMPAFKRKSAPNAKLDGLNQSRKRAVAQIGLSEGRGRHAHRVQHRDQQVVVRSVGVLERAPGTEVPTPASHQERDALMRMSVALGNLVAPQHQGVVEHAAGAFRDLTQARQEVREQLAVPGLAGDELRMRVVVARPHVRQGVPLSQAVQPRVA